MGKKSREKRERRASQAQFSPAQMLVELMRSGMGAFTADEGDFQKKVSAISRHFQDYAAQDVAVSLAISDLWLPNISSQVKHTLAVAVLAALSPESFTPTRHIDSYTNFCEFLNGLYSHLPSNPMLEDYVPEQDWGEVRIKTSRGFQRIFYGANVERIPDFIDAFRLHHVGNIEAARDMDAAIAIQNNLLTLIPRSSVGVEQDIDNGHIEIPSEAFWLSARDAILRTAQMCSGTDFVSAEMIIALGSGHQLSTAEAFGEATMTGAAVPAIALKVAELAIPVLARNITAAIIEFWHAKSNAYGTDHGLEVERAISSFLADRFRQPLFLPGPLQFSGPSGRLKYVFAGVLKTDTYFYPILHVDSDDVKHLPAMESAINAFIMAAGDWRMALVDRSAQFGFVDGKYPKPKEIIPIAILNSVTTVSGFFERPKGRSRVLYFPDFVTIFDSLEEVEELDRFWAFVDLNESTLAPMSTGTADLFASFRDAHGLIVDGAVSPDMIALDPHWGSNWRYKTLREFWEDAPTAFPDGRATWILDPKENGLAHMGAKGRREIAWSTSVSDCVVQFTNSRAMQNLDRHRMDMLLLFMHCLTDAINQRRDILISSSAFTKAQIIIACVADEFIPVDAAQTDDLQASAERPLLALALSGPPDTDRLNVRMKVNLSRVQLRLQSPTDASFEVESVKEFVRALHAILGTSIAPIEAALEATSTRLPRFTVTQTERKVDVPDYSSPELPDSEHFKVARRDLAVVIRGLRVKEGRYELKEAKAIIDAARDQFRAQIHSMIAAGDRTTIVEFCVEQHDALISQDSDSLRRLHQSLSHEVEFDRSERMAERQVEFTRSGRNLRYLLEAALSLPPETKPSKVSIPVLQLLGHVDWLLTLYQASDILHNELEVGGIDIDSQFIPEITYSEHRGKNEAAFNKEMADIRLGIGIRKDDQVDSKQDKDTLAKIEQAFRKDLGFSFTDLFCLFTVLAQWPSHCGESEFRHIYSAPRGSVRDILVAQIEGFTADIADRVIAFATLDPLQIRQLPGRDIAEGDVPVWEHTKRLSRYTIRPLLNLKEDNLTWGAATIHRARGTWQHALSEGYLPADFNWPATKKVARDIKESLENDLESVSFAIAQRGTPLALHGIDFHKRFPKEKFDDAGDFDVLAYWPEMNHWVYIECKYNQPPFCIKDARRLRERIFGDEADGAQFAKIERRRTFFQAHKEKLRTLLGWPEPRVNIPEVVSEIYVSRTLYWWMRYPPYVVPTTFLQVDMLDAWLRSQGLIPADAPAGAR